MSIRLNKYLANVGFTSRRKIAALLKEKEVLVNGKRALEPGVRIDPEKDQITIDGEKVSQRTDYECFILNKPKGVISTARDELGRKTVVSLIKSKARLYPVGRLDETSTGLILLTNDGELANKLTHPRYHAPKTYQIIISNSLLDWQLKALREGVFLKDRKTSPSEVEVLEKSPKRTVLEITLHEGRNHQVKRMCAKLKLNLISLKRVAFGSLQLGDLGLGESRKLTPQEVEKLKSIH